MVQKYTAPVRIYKYPFELVMAAYHRRFPTCHLIPVFAGSDVISETDDGIVQIVERSCRINVDAPYILRKITGVDHVMFIQRNTLDRRKRTLTIEAKNDSFVHHIHIHELCVYKATSSNETAFEQQASLEVKSFFGFEHVVERIAVKHYSANIKKGEEIIEYHIAQLADEGIHHIEPFTESIANSIDSSNSNITIANSAGMVNTAQGTTVQSPNPISPQLEGALSLPNGNHEHSNGNTISGSNSPPLPSNGTLIQS